MRVVLHGLSYHVGDLVEFAVVDLVQRVEDAALDGFEPIVDVRNCTIPNGVRGVFEEVVVVEIVDIGH